MKRLLTVMIFAFIFILVVGCSNDANNTNNASDANNNAKNDTAANSDDGSTWEPEQSIEFLAPSGAGGGWDTTARMAAKVLNDEGIIDQSIGVINKEGGGGAVGWAYIASKDDSPYNLFVSSPPIMFVPLNGQSEYSHEDFTPLSNLIADYGAFAVREDSEWDDLNDLFDAMKESPDNITVVGNSSPGSMDHMQFIQIAKAAGVDIKKVKYVSDQEGGGLTQLLNGSVDVFSAGVAETVEQAKAGKIKVLGVTSEERLSGDTLEDFPTAMEQGIDESFTNWRGFFGPPNMEEEVAAYYEEKFKELSDSEAFAEIRDQFGWNEMYMDREEYKAFLDDQKEELGTLLDELGLSE